MPVTIEDYKQALITLHRAHKLFNLACHVEHGKNAEIYACMSDKDTPLVREARDVYNDAHKHFCYVAQEYWKTQKE